MRTKGIIVFPLLFLVVLTLAAVSGFIFFSQPRADHVGQEPPHGRYLRDFLAGSGLVHVPAIKNDFAYYTLHAADRRLAGFVFLGTEEGWAGPINLFVKTDGAGIIQRVHVWRHTETPLYVEEMDEYLETFAGHAAEAELVWQEDVHGITGATFTAEAIIGAVSGSGRAAYQKGIFMR